MTERELELRREHCMRMGHRYGRLVGLQATCQDCGQVSTLSEVIADFLRFLELLDLESCLDAADIRKIEEGT